MVEDRTTDGVRLAQLLSSELDGREDGEFARFAVENADRDVEPTDDGARAYEVTRDGEPFAVVFVQPDRIRIELEVGLDAAVEKAKQVGLRVRPKATQPPKTLVFVEDGAEVKRATDVVDAASQAAESE
ncbi:hypothetical protein [Haloarchaeobius sp. HME9146]|uniref:hypothetical protein n=1 Tax=Haloarchaeobius sp. HME9146 TaxID=2978732 RepID=UPI0021BE1398|nr:hypothetical protein [Haloarchaeobius sp. HME9146]MCT9097458.1 hypothetical protein [Haloarchaeobius sp. HME9146]